MDDLTPCQWLARCAARLGERWRTVAASELEAAAIEVWRDEGLRELAPEDAAVEWLAPVNCAGEQRLPSDIKPDELGGLTGGIRPVSR